MGVMTRLVRLCKADIHGVMDQLEDKGLMLKQHLRDMQEELDRKEARLNKMGLARERAQEQLERHTKEIERLEQDLAFAIAREKDDVARFLIKKLKPLSQHRDEISRHVGVMDQDVARFRGSLEEQMLTYEKLQLRAMEYLQKVEREEWQDALSSVGPQGASQEPSEVEIELELLARKAALKGGRDK
jgi:phage shock protein A